VNRRLVLSGIAFVALLVVSVIGLGGGTPGSDASAEKLASFYSDNETRQWIGSFLLAASAPFVVLFGVGVAKSTSSAWASVLVAGTALVAGSILVNAFVHFALVDSADKRVPGSVLQALNALDANTWMMFNPAFGVIMVGAAGVLLTGALYRRLGWIASVIAVAAFIPYADFIALLATLIWIVVAASMVGREKPIRSFAPAASSA
jgi:hypothetical protein